MGEPGRLRLGLGVCSLLCDNVVRVVMAQEVREISGKAIHQIEVATNRSGRWSIVA